jgi:hypothetical protein
VLPDGSVVAPRTVEHPGPRPASPVGVGIGAGVGGGSGGWSGGGGFGITFGLGGPGQGLRGAGQAERLTRADFLLAEAGPAPWRLRLKVVGTPPVEILLDPARAG